MNDMMLPPMGMGSLSNWSIGNSTGFPDPFTDMASLAMPNSPQQIMRWCEFIVMAKGEYNTALRRVLSYFITSIDVSDAGDDEIVRYESYLNDTLGVNNWLHTVGFDYLTYGNAYASLLMPFRRYLVCPKCFVEHPLGVVFDNREFRFRWSNYTFNAVCQRCKYSGEWRVQDRRGDAGGVRLRRWSPHEIELLWDPFTDDTHYLWKIPSDYKQLITEGKLFMLERANMEVIKAIKNNQHFRFAPGALFHMREEALAGIKNRGLGISRVLSNFRQSWYVQVLHRYNEAIALDYIIPFRVITPTPGPGGGSGEARDPVFNMGMGGFVGKVKSMLGYRRRDPASWNVLPFPIQYQALGGDARNLAPKELLDQGIELLLNNVGVPVELFKGSLQVQTAPAALRLFESHWSHLVNNLNRFLRFLANKLSELLNWEKVTLRLIRVTTADDLNKQMAKLQLMTGHQISQQTGLKSIDVDWKDEIRRIMSEQRYTAQQQQKMQEEMESEGLMQQMLPNAAQVASAEQQQQQQGDGAGGGDPAASGGGQPQPGAPASPVQQALANTPTGDNVQTTPQELMEKAQVLAQQILSLPESQKDSELIQLKKGSPTLHALVKSNIDAMRQQARTAGGAMMMAQQGMGGQPPQQ